MNEWTGFCMAGLHGLDFEGQVCDVCAAATAVQRKNDLRDNATSRAWQRSRELPDCGAHCEHVHGDQADVEQVEIDDLRNEVCRLKAIVSSEITPLLREAGKTERLRWLTDLGGTALKEYGDHASLSAYGRANAFNVGARAIENRRLLAENELLHSQRDRAELHQKTATDAAHELLERAEKAEAEVVRLNEFIAEEARQGSSVVWKAMIKNAEAERDAAVGDINEAYEFLEAGAATPEIAKNFRNHPVAVWFKVAANSLTGAIVEAATAIRERAAAVAEIAALDAELDTLEAQRMGAIAEAAAYRRERDHWRSVALSHGAEGHEP